MGKLMLFINSIKVKHKLFMIYLFCIFLPFFIINSIFLDLISKNFRSHEIQNLNHMLTKMDGMLTTSIDDAVRLSHKLYSSRSLYEALDTEYETDMHFVVAYYDFYRLAIIDNTTYYNQVLQVNIYTDNMTMINSNGIKKLDSYNQYPWYTEIQQSSQSILLYPNVTYNNVYKTNQRFVSIIRKLDQYSQFSKYQKLAKIDLNYSIFSELAETLNYNSTLFIVDNLNQIIYSNNPTYFLMEMELFPQFDVQNLDKNHTVIEHTIHNNVLLRDWKIVLMHPENEIYEMLSRTSNYVVIVAGISLLVATSIILIVSKSFQDRLRLLTTQMNRLKDQDFSVIKYDKIGNDEIGVVMKTYNQMTTKIVELIQAVYEAQIREKNIEIARKQSELNALQAQVNPHYLMNVLEAVRMKLALKGDLETSIMLKHIFRTIRKIITWEHDWNTIQDEIEIIKSFLEIQRYRYGDEIAYTLEVDESIKGLKIPKMIFHPFVENACLHGVNGIDKRGLVEVRISRSGEYVHFQIKDNGRGITTEKLNQLKYFSQAENFNNNSSIGIANVLKRLYLYYDNEFTFQINSELNEYTRIDLMLPLWKGPGISDSQVQED